MPLGALLNAIAPPLCAGCGAAAGAAEPLCGDCRRELRWLGREPVEVGEIPAMLVWAPVAYEGPARGLVQALKFKGATRAAGAMAAQIAAQAPAGWLRADGPPPGPAAVARPPQPAVALVPVPLHPARRRRRGFNQAERLAAAVGARVGLAVSDCLERAGPRGTQVGRDRAQRLSGIAGSIKLAPERAPPRQRAVLVDDVVTTGATLAACAAVLHANGAAEVVAIAYARTPGR